MHEAVSRRLFDEAAAGFTPELCAIRNWTVLHANYPILEVEFAGVDRKPLRIRARCESWNSLPPSIEFLDLDGRLMNPIPQGPGGQLNAGPHSATKLPFVCMAGVREYHSHEGHTSDLWENHKEKPGYDLGGIITQIWRAWLEARP